MELINKIVDFFVDEKYRQEGITPNPELEGTTYSGESIKAEIKKVMKGRLIEEVLSDRKKELDQYAKDVVAEERRKSKVTTIKQLLWEGFFVAILVTLLGNEITAALDFFKQLFQTRGSFTCTIALIIVYAVILVVFFAARFTTIILDTFTRRGR